MSDFQYVYPPVRNIEINIAEDLSDIILKTDSREIAGHTTDFDLQCILLPP